MKKDWTSKTPTVDEWREILEKHARWARGESDGERADLRGAYLRGADIQGAYLQGADLRGADLQGADLRGADLQGADLHGADLQGAYLQRAYLRGAYLRGADIQGAYLRGADLRGADLQRADLQGADLRGADIKDVKGGDLAIARTRILPEGDLIAWKKCRDGVIVKIRIPADVPRSHAFGRKCRSAAADVLEVFGADVGVSIHDGQTEYRAGKRVLASAWDADWTNECSSGIHWYISRIEAEAHE